MALVNEQIVSGRKFRKLIDETTRLWLRISFWTKASDVEFDDGETAETKFADIIKTITDLKTSFQDGVNKIFNYLKGLGFTPNPNSPDGICAAIKNMYDKRYSDGRAQGREDVKANPESYGVSTKSKFVQLIAAGQAGGSQCSYTCPATGTYNIKVSYAVHNNGGHNAITNLVRLIADKNYDYVCSNANIDHNCVPCQNHQVITLNLSAGQVIRLEADGWYMSSDTNAYTVAMIEIW